MNDIIAYIETQDHEGLVRIEAILRTLAYMDLVDLTKANLSKMVPDQIVSSTLTERKRP